MSLVIATNKDQDGTFRQDQSIYSAYSFRNSLSSVYKIPAHSQVCLQSAKVNLDGRATVTGNNSNWFDWFGLDLGLARPQEETTSYPITQSFHTGDGVDELTSSEIASAIKRDHREFHPNRMGQFDCKVNRGAGLDFLGFEFQYGFETKQTNTSKPKTFNSFKSGIPELVAEGDTRFTWNQGTGVFQRVDIGDEGNPVAIGLGHPISVSNGSMRVDFNDANASGVTWSIGLSRDCPAPQLYRHGNVTSFYAPPYCNLLKKAPGAAAQGLEKYFSDFKVSRNPAGELVVTHFVTDDQGLTNYQEEVEYWTNTASTLKGAGRYDIDKNAGGYGYIEYRIIGEQVELYIRSDAGGTFLITKYDPAQPKNSYFKPVSQTCWCLHPTLLVGHTATNKTNSLTIDSFSGMDITGYDSRTLYKGGWFESMGLLADTGSSYKGMATCQVVDSRVLTNSPTFAGIYSPVTLNASNYMDEYYNTMIVAPNTLYVETQGAAVADLFGFSQTSLVEVNTETEVGTIILNKINSETVPGLTSTQSIFVRLNGMGNQVLNARTGNKSTILAHLPTADSRATTDKSGRFFYEPNRDVWLDLDNSYEIQTSDFSIDFVYANEQYSKVLQGQSIVVLYFRVDPKFA